MSKQEDVEEKVDAESEAAEEIEREATLDEDAVAEDDPEEEAEEEQVEEEEDPLTTANREAEAHKDRWMRLAAEFDNYKKRTLREMQSLIESANESLIRELLPTIDSVSLGIGTRRRGR